jgi:Trypsin
MRRCLRAVFVMGAVLAVARSASAVEGGAEDRVTTHAVAIATGGPQSPSVRCSGTLIAPNVVLTVRHCIARFPDPEPSCTGSFPEPSGVPSDFWVTAAPWTLPSDGWRNVASWVVPEPTDVCGNDVALLVLARPFTAAEATPARPILGDRELRDALSTRLVGIAGFGASSANGKDDGTRRSRFDIALACVPGDPSFACGAELDTIDFSEFTGGAGPCIGDSGAGAILTTDHAVIFGVLSRGNLGSGACGAGVFERTDVWGWLIAKTVLGAATPDVPAPAWTKDTFPDHPDVGQRCRGGGDCVGEADCVSFDGRRSFVCAKRCSSGCSNDSHCESNVCAPGAAPNDTSTGCAISPSPSSATSVAVFVLLLLARAVRDRRDRARGVCDPARPRA